MALKLRSGELVISSLQNWIHPSSHWQPMTTQGSRVAESTSESTLCREKGRQGRATCVQLLSNLRIRLLTYPLLRTSGEGGQEGRTADVPPLDNMGISKCNHLMSFLALKLYSIMVLFVITRSHFRAKLEYGFELLWFYLYYYYPLNSNEGPSIMSTL